MRIKLPFIYDSYDFNRYFSNIKYYINYDGNKIILARAILNVIIVFTYTFLFVYSGLAWFFAFLIYPMTVITSSLILFPFIYIIPYVLVKIQIKKNEQEEIKKRKREEIEKMKPKIFSTKEMKKIISEYEEKDIPKGFVKPVKAIIKKLNRLVEAVETNDYDPVKLTKMFKTYLPDVMKLVFEHENNKNINENMADMDDEIVSLLYDFVKYIEEETEIISSPKVYDAKATIDVYRKIFNNNHQLLGDVKEENDDEEE